MSGSSSIRKHKFPNFESLRELKRQLEGDNGTIFRYATHENTILRDIREQLENSDQADKRELMHFIDSITNHKEGREKLSGPRDMVDLLENVKKYYYHPGMKGSNSIKVVLPAILNSSKAIQKKYSQPIYGSLIPSKNFGKDNAKALLRYCELDTMSMVFIWEYFDEMTKKY